MHASVFASPIASTTFSIDSVHPDFTDASLELGAGDSVRCKTIRLGALASRKRVSG
jgi:hypothetical protein